MAYINPSYGFINYSNIRNEELLNEKLLNGTDKFHYNKQCDKKYNNIEYYGKMCISTVFYDKNKNNFSFPSYCSVAGTDTHDELFSKFYHYILHSEVSRFFINSHFLERFYKTYAKIYYSKMASTVRNYTVESISLKSSIFPFETAFNDFINQYNDFNDAINEITSNILYLCTKRFIKFSNYIGNGKKYNWKECNISFYDLFFRPNYVSKKLSKAISIGKEFKFDNVPSSIIIDDISYNDLKHCIKNNDIEEINLKECNRYIKASSLVYTIIKHSIRYSFILQLKQAFGWFLDKNKEKYPEIKSIISDTNLYYTQNLINIRQNIKYLKNIIIFCDSILCVKRNKKAIMNKDDNIKSFSQYVKSIIDHMRSYNNVDMKIMNDLKNLYITCFDRNSSQSVVYNTEMYKTLKTTSEYFCIRNETSLTNIQKYNFNDRWNEVIDNDSIINPINYIEHNVIKEF